MKSMNNWLTFSVQSPHLAALDALKQPVDSISHHQSAPTRSAITNSTNSLILSSMSQNHSNSLGGYQNSASDCYNSLRSSGDGGNSNSSQGLEMMRSDGSLCIMEALSRSHSAAESHWPQQRQAMQSDGGVQPHTLLTPDQLSRLTGNPGATAGDQGMQPPSHTHYDMQTTTSGETRDGPKLEDFLGGASLGGQYSDTRETQQQQLDSLGYYTPTNAAANQSRINVNLPYSHVGGGSLHDVPPSFHVAYGGVGDGSALTYDHPHAHHESTASLGNRMHAQNLLQAALDQSARLDSAVTAELLLPQNQNPAGNHHDYEIKSWLRNQAAAEKASGRLTTLASLQPLTLSITAGSQNPNVVATPQLIAESPTGTPEPRKRGAGRAGSKEPSPRKSIDTFGQRTSVYRGVTRHRWTGRYEAHLWDNSCRKEGQTRKGRQVYLGGYDKEEKAARAYDLAALKYWGPSTTINFPLTTYETELEEMKNMSRQEYVASLRRKSSGFSRGASMYRGVTRHHQHGRWQARIGRVAGNKDLYLGTYSTQEEAAEAYDIAAIKFRGINAVTNFDISRYDAARIQQASMNGHHGQEAMKAAKDAELAAMSSQAAQSAAHTAAHALSTHTQRQLEDHQDHVQATPTHTHTSTSQLTGSPPSSLTKNLHEWQLLYQQQAHQQQQHQSRNNWDAFQDSSMRAPNPSNQSKFPPPTNGMLLRNLMGLEALPQEHRNEQALLQQGMSSSGSMMSTSTFQGAPGPDQRGPYGHGGEAYQSGDRGVGDSPKHSVGESEAESSVLQGDMSRNVLYMSPGGSSQGKMGGYESGGLSPWISSNPATVQGLGGRANLSELGSGGGPIFASWNA
ncbi:hypothetical protein M758_7G113800 [Ceratodon purpureus]|nr:hypothetical protein M758_7G113800 [Ceratodon purpureus]